jgi:hypothetical protein
MRDYSLYYIPGFVYINCLLIIGELSHSRETVCSSPTRTQDSVSGWFIIDIVGELSHSQGWH